MEDFEKYKNPFYVLSLSFGKDSVALLLHIIKNKLPLDKIVHCKIMYDKKLSGEHPIMANWIPEAEQKINKLLLDNGYNCKVENVTASEPYKTQVLRIRKRGKYKGKRLGFPNPRCAWCNTLLKLKPTKDYLSKYIKQGYIVVEYIGIALDEPKRLERYKKIATETHRYITLADFGIEEQEAMEMCEENNLLSPMYKNQFRGGCWMCPKQSINSLYLKWKEYPDLYDKLIEIEKILRAENNAQSSFYYGGLFISEIIEKFKNGYIPKQRKKKPKQFSMFDITLLELRKKMNQDIFQKGGSNERN